MGKPILCFLAVLVAFSACGKSRRSDDDAGLAGDTGMPTGGNGPTSGGGSGSGATSSGGSAGMASAGCVVVRRLGCCAAAFAVTREELDADECLIAFDQGVIDSTLRDRCAARHPATCIAESGNCSVQAPPSRVAKPDADGVCQFADECTTDDDCTFAAQCCRCCACSEPMPKSRARAETCVVSADPSVETEPMPGGCLVCPGGNLCQGCYHEHTLSCSPTPQGLHRCEWGDPLAETDCTVERPCGGPPPGMPNGMQCIAPDLNCGGPAPPPDECADDADCNATGDGRICSPTGYCNQAVCIPGCTSDADCTPAELCTAAHHCEPKPCTDRSVCGPNFDCTGGVCSRKVCAATTACEGYCVNQRCFDEPGFCSFPPL